MSQTPDGAAAAPVIPQDPDGSRIGLPRALLILLGLAAAVVAVAGIKSIGDIVAPTFLALTLVITTHPLQKWLVAHRVPRFAAAAICLVILYATVLGLMGALSLSIAQLAILMPNYTADFIQLYDNTLAWLTDLGVNEQQLANIANGIDPTSLVGVARSALDQVAGVTSALIFLITVLFFLIVDAMDIPRRSGLAERAQPLFAKAMGAFAAGVRRYWLVSAVFGLIVAVLDTVGLYFIGVPLALLWGLVSFITNFIPNIGFVLGLIPPALLALLDGGVGKMVAVIVLYSVLNVLVQVIIQPKFTGDAVGVTPAVSFLSLAFWTFVLGPLGALLALPMTLFVKTMLVDGDPRAQWVNALISSNPREALPTVDPPGADLDSHADDRAEGPSSEEHLTTPNEPPPEPAATEPGPSEPEPPEPDPTDPTPTRSAPGRRAAEDR